MTNFPQPLLSENKPEYVVAMEGAYGPPSQNGFGSGVFFERLAPADDLDQAARRKYEFFVGKNWERFGEEAWLSAWKKVYSRPPGTRPDIVAELEGIRDPAASQSVPMMLTVVEKPDLARQALASAYNDSAMVELTVINLGDGGAMSGLLVAGRRENGEATFLVFLMD